MINRLKGRHGESGAVKDVPWMVRVQAVRAERRGMVNAGRVAG